MMVYITKQGDMWDAIAFTQLGSTSYTGALMALNGRYCGLVTLPAGIALELPEKAETKDATLPPWKKASA